MALILSSLDIFNRATVEDIPCKVLQKHEHDRDDDTVTDSRSTAFAQHLESAAGTIDELKFVLNAGLNISHLTEEVRVVLRQIADPGQVLEGKLIAVLADQPTRRLNHEGHEDQQETDGDELDTDGNSPLLGI